MRKIKSKIRLLIARLKAAKWFFDNQNDPELIVKTLIDQNRRDYPVLYHIWLYRKWQSEAEHIETDFYTKGKITVTFYDKE